MGSFTGLLPPFWFVSKPGFRLGTAEGSSNEAKQPQKQIEAPPYYRTVACVMKEAQQPRRSRQRQGYRLGFLRLLVQEARY